MSDSRTMYELNEQLARKIHEEVQRDPNSPYTRKYVGIANGRVVVAADDLYEIIRYLKESEPDPEKRYCAWIDPNTHFGAENEIWELR